ncbi:MAG: SRPBCC family protein [Moraxellaceae bacterium]|nr:SRPBCC family protein [Moraxellaceae bacterium]
MSHAADHDAREFVHVRVIDAPREQVFAAFTDATRIARWWGPRGFTSTIHHFDPQPGGRWQLTLHGPDGNDYPNENVFVELSPTRIVIDHPSPTHHFVLTVDLQDDDGRTRVEWRQRFDSAEHAEAIAAVVRPANEENLERLAVEVMGGR